MIDPKKSLGQHWLFDRAALQAVAKAGELDKSDTVLEIGPGLGSLTKVLVERAGRVFAIEKDEELAVQLSSSLKPANLEVIAADILEFDTRGLPAGYKVVANLPYYLTSKLLRSLLENANPPSLMSLLVQKEVGERIVAKPGQMSLLALSVQYYAEPKLLRVVPKELFEPPPQVDAALIQVKRRLKPAFHADTTKLFRLIRAGFTGRRKQLKNSLAAGLHMESAPVAGLLRQLGIDPNSRTQKLSLTDWQRIYQKIPLD